MKTETEITEVTEKLCLKCDEVKPATAFNRRRGTGDGLQSACRACFTLYYSKSEARRKVAVARKPLEVGLFNDFMRIGL